MSHFKKLQTTFTELFGTKPVHYYFSPGRINLIGEHTDYNGGHVFPAAITLGTYGVAAKRSDQEVVVYSMNFQDAGVIRFQIDDLVYKKADSWANYVKGVLYQLKQRGHQLDSGFELVIDGTIPNGAGLSSSASLELLIGVVAEDLYQLKTDRLELVKVGQETENQFIGVNSGIMDQFAVGFGQAGQALLLDASTLKYEMVPAELGDYAIVIMNTNKRRELADSKYNERRSECESALADLQKVSPIQTLGDLTAVEFEELQKAIQNPIEKKRARHAVYENERTLKAKEALQKNDLAAFGQLLNESHQSLKVDYEVTGIELDTLVDAAQKQPGVLGARMTGAGFGGCSIALVKESEIPAFEKKVHAAYLKEIGYAPAFYSAHIGNGTLKVPETDIKDV